MLQSLAMAWGRPAVLLAIGAVCMAAACSTISSAPLGKGDTIYVDVEASTLPKQQPDDASDDSSVFARVDGSDIYGAAYDAYAALTVCEPPDGSTSEKGDSGKKGDGAAGSNPVEPDSSIEPEGGSDDAAAPYAAADGGAACEPLPAACASQPDCECLLNALAASLPCTYPNCRINHGFHIYCP